MDSLRFNSCRVEADVNNNGSNQSSTQGSKDFFFRCLITAGINI